MSYTSIVKCICDTPDEEYGSMVQCDDCQRWLHLDCLKMSEAVLGETFRCPLCFVALGKETNKLVSSMTWRFAARRQSEQLAAANSDDSETSDCEQEQHYQNHSINSTSSSIQNRRRRSRLQQQKSPQEQEQREEFQQQQQQQQQQLELSIVAPERNMVEEDDDGHRSEDSSSSGSSPSEASTPEQTFYPTDPFDAMDTDFSNNNNNSQMILDPDSIDFFSRLIYLQSLDSMQKEIFAPNASDVFLCDDS
ncbi:hypothetical protein BDC45DRAFT_76616 [Circinella umbellata]|nr:hypothetical protein BDC45DRAFT_76616 [Circinella umbellata]